MTKHDDDQARVAPSAVAQERQDLPRSPLPDSSRHTPGPWQLHRRGSMRACDGAHDTADGCRTLAEAEILNMPRAEAEANARLIAAAPELLGALQLIRQSSGDPVIEQIAETAIAKAEGRG